MEFRTLELNIVSAKDLKDVNLIGKMNVYAVVSLSGETHVHQKTKTSIHRNGGTSPTWNFPIRFTVNETLADQNRLTLEFKLLCHRTLTADKEIGRVLVPVKQLLDQTGDGKSFQHVSYQVIRPSRKTKGAFNFSYKFGRKIDAPAKPGAAEPYPAPTAGSSASAPPYPGGYPPSAPQYNNGTGHGYPPSAPAVYDEYPPSQAGYGYPLSQAGYGYPPQGGYRYPQAPVQRPGRNRFGMGLGAGLVGGALGGILIGEMMSDAGGYDGGFGDSGGGFDF